VRIVRRGSWWNFNLIVPGVLRREFSAPPPHLIVEDINKAPCFTPWWTRSPVAAVVPHLFGATAFQEASLPVALDDLVRRGIARDRIAVVHCGLDHDAYRHDPAVAKDVRPTIVFVGRLRRYKGVDLVMRALPRVRERVPGARLVVLGDGPFGSALHRMAERLGVAGAVEFRGFVPTAAKVRALQEGWVLVQPSPKEGWGLTVIEAGACATAVVASDSPGLRDSVVNDRTGLLVPGRDDAPLADALIRVLTDDALRERLAHAGLEWAARFRWPDCAARSMDALLEGLPAGEPR